MKKLVSTFLLLILLYFSANAKLWRLNNNGSNPQPPILADFTTTTTLQQAHDNVAVTSGDTIHVEQSPTTYGNCIFTKRLVIIGAGYALANNPQTQVNTAWNSLVGSLTFANTGAVGSKIIGITSNSTGHVIAVSNIEFSRCNISTGTNAGGILLTIGTTDATDISDVKINGCYFNYGYFIAFYSGGAYPPVPIIGNNSGTGKVLNLNIQGNIFINNGGGSTYSSSTFTFGAGVVFNTKTAGILKNNIFSCNAQNISVCNFYVLNNIAETSFGANSFTNSRFEYNLGINDNQFVTPSNTNSANGAGNQTLASFGFAGGTSPDGKYQITSGIALTAGKSNLPCGIFGGDFPYHLSGIAPIPNIYSLTIAPVSAGATTMSVTLSTKSNN